MATTGIQLAEAMKAGMLQSAAAPLAPIVEVGGAVTTPWYHTVLDHPFVALVAAVAILLTLAHIAHHMGVPMG